MQLDERNNDYYNRWIQRMHEDWFDLSEYELINYCYEKHFEKSRDISIDEAEAELFESFSKSFSKKEWEEKEKEHKEIEKQNEAHKLELLKRKEKFHEKLWTLPVVVSRNVQRFRDQLEKDNRLRSIPKVDFYLLDKWLIMKRFVSNLFGDICMDCGKSKASFDGGIEMQVDHIEPRSKVPEKELDIENFQVLCKKCNHKKRDFVSTDFRTKEDKELVHSLYTEKWDKIVKIYMKHEEESEEES